MKKFSIIVATDSQNGIGKKGDLPWQLSKDMAFFKQITSYTEREGKKNAVIMGHKTWKSIPDKFRPLPDRLNIVASRESKLKVPAGVIHAPDLEELLDNLEKLAETHNIDNFFVIGGGALYKTAITHAACDSVYLTQIKGDFKCDTFFPTLPKKFTQLSLSEWDSENKISFRFIHYIK